MKFIMGLGNPGRNYRGTPHNLGVETIDLLAARWKWKLKKSLRYKSMWVKNKFALKEVFLVKSLTYVNLSGQVIRKFFRYYNFEDLDFILIYDDAALDLGDIRIKRKGSSGGHKGIESVIESLGTNLFTRIRLGIATDKMKNINLEKYVLARWGKKERIVCNEMLNRTTEAVEMILTDGVEKAMNVYN
jgi:PTH1 family peptidyl-tRNA hydrolase